MNDVDPKTKKILQLLRLRQINMGVFLKVRRVLRERWEGNASEWRSGVPAWQRWWARHWHQTVGEAYCWTALRQCR